jgi:hypothetical protein
MTEDYETTDDRDFDAEDFGTLSIGRLINSGSIEFATRDSGNSSSAAIPINDIWDVIDHLIELAGPRAFAVTQEMLKDSRPVGNALLGIGRAIPDPPVAPQG